MIENKRLKYSIFYEALLISGTIMFSLLFLFSSIWLML